MGADQSLIAVVAWNSLLTGWALRTTRTLDALLSSIALLASKTRHAFLAQWPWHSLRASRSLWASRPFCSDFS